jgi:predicted PurR-regulated permease PerM
MSAFDSDRDRAKMLIATLGLAIAVAVFPLASGLVGALVLYVGATPVHQWMSRRISPRVAAAIIVVATALLIFLPAAWLLTVVIDRTPDVLRELRDSRALARLVSIRIGEIDIGTRVLAAGGSVVSWVSTQAFRVLGGAMRGTLNAVLALFGLYFLLRSGPAAWRTIARYIPFSQEGTDHLADRFRQVTEATLLGTALTALLQGVVVALGFALTGLGDPWFWGVVTAVVSVVPMFGSALVWLPGTLVLAGQDRHGAAAVLGVIGAVIASNIDNVMRPVVNRRVSHLHPMTTLVGAFAGVGVLGLPGILLGPLAIAYFFELIALYAREHGSRSRAAAEAHGVGVPAMTTGGH